MQQLQQGEKWLMPTIETPAPSTIGIGLGWDHPEGNMSMFDLDVSAFLLTPTGLIPSKKYFIYYRNMSSPNNEVVHSGDNRSGAGAGDDECLWVELPKVDEGVSDILFMVSIHEGQMKHQHFGQLSNAYIRAFRKEGGKELVRYSLKDELIFFDTAEFGRLSKTPEGWYFHATGKGEHGGLESLLKMYSDKR